MNTLGVVMAGGRNVRFGGLKAFAKVNGKPIVERVVAALRACADEVVVIANDFESYQLLGLPMRADERPHAAALGGLLTALHWARERDLANAAVVACDMPFASASLLREMLESLQDCDMVVPQSGGRRGVEPLFAIYSTSCIPAIEAAIERDDLRMVSFHESVRVCTVPIEEVQRHGDPGVLFMNVNTPDELAEAERIARENTL